MNRRARAKYNTRMTGLYTRVRGFFDGYERSNADVHRIAACYADVFMFGGPADVQPVKREDFVKVLPRRKEFFRSAGLVSSKIASLEVSKLVQICLGEVVWRMRFGRNGADPIESDNSAMYILSAGDDRFEIVFQIDHQDLAKRIQKLGLK
jgi:hypothetical protein